MFTESTQSYGCEPGGNSLTPELGIFFFIKHCGVRTSGVRESRRSMCRGEREQPDCSPKVVRQVRVKGMWVSQDGNLSMGSWLSTWEHIICAICRLMEDRGVCRDPTLSSPLIWLWDWRVDPELSLSPQPLPSGVPCDGLIIHPDTFPLPADDTRERLLHGSGSLQVAARQDRAPALPAAQLCHPDSREASSPQWEWDHCICWNIHEAEVQAGLCLRACMPVWAGRSRDQEVLGPCCQPEWELFVAPWSVSLM